MKTDARIIGDLLSDLKLIIYTAEALTLAELLDDVTCVVDTAALSAGGNRADAVWTRLRHEAQVWAGHTGQPA